MMVLSCADVPAQEVPNILRIHLSNASVQEFAIASVDSITFPDSMTIHLSSGNIRRFDVETVDSVVFTVATNIEQYEAVDLGLSVKWAVCNVGAIRPEDAGEFFAWGEIIPKKDYSEAAYTYYGNTGYEYIGVNICGTKYDVARQAWGGDWRLPTRSEIRELTTRCTWTAETRNDINGYRVTGINGNSIFLPAAGYKDGEEHKEIGTGGFYWSGSLNRSMTSSAYNLNFRGYDAEWTASRFYGFSVRAVR